MSRYDHLKRSSHTDSTSLLLTQIDSPRSGRYSSTAAAYLNNKLAGHIGATTDGRFYSVGRSKAIAEFSTNSLSLFAVMNLLKSTTK